MPKLVRKWHTILLALLPFLFKTVPAYAACHISAASISFGNYDVFASTNLLGTGTVQTSGCPGSSGTATADAGVNSGGSFNPRKMKLSSGSDLLNYNLYTDSARTVIWNTSSGVIDWSGNTTVTFYGSIPSGQTNAGIGTYQDIVTVTINF
jgi:spore coat protein U-like protein